MKVWKGAVLFVILLCCGCAKQSPCDQVRVELIEVWDRLEELEEQAIENPEGTESSRIVKEKKELESKELDLRFTLGKLQCGGN